jgi:hypothetical protein
MRNRSLPVELLSNFGRITPKHGTTSARPTINLVATGSSRSLRGGAAQKPDLQLAPNNLQYARTMTKASAK